MSSVRCASCDSELLEGKKFCHVCGTAVSRRCSSCGAEVGAQFRFCTDCGQPIGPAAAPTPAPRPVADDRLTRHIPEDLARKIRATGGGVAGERKLVSVLFCDLVGSTSIAERLDPEEYHDLLDEYLELAFREVYRVEGIVNQLNGDGFMALFGAPVAHEDAPQRAIAAALGIRDAVAALAERVARRQGFELRVRVGVHTGPVVVGAVGSDLKTDYSAIGDTTNLAARLQSLAEHGTVLVSQTTERLVRGFFETRARPGLQVKGKREPVDAFEILRATGVSAPMAIAEARGLTPLVGRDAELGQITGSFSLAAERLPQVVAVVGDAGSGKSRLVYELRQRIADREHLFFEARCSSLSQGLPYAPIAGMLRQFFEITPGEPAASAREKMAARIGDVGRSLEEWVPYLWRLLGVCGGELDDDRPAEELKRGTIEAVCRLAGAASERLPAILMVEDLHWMDESSREMIEVAVSRLRHERMMILVTHRPDFEPRWQTQAAFTRLTLRRLADDQAKEIARAVAGGRLPAELERSIVERAEGNPFYVEELVRTLVEEGALLRGDSEIRLARPLSEIRVPTTVHEILAARLDRLGGAGKRVVQVASVIGRQFRRSELAALVGADVALERELEALEQRGILHRKTALGDDEYRFGESLTQEVAYEGLLLKERRQLHDRVAALVVASPGDPTAERSALLAHHLARGEDRARAIEALLGAARDAERLPSYRTAAGFYRQGWEIAEAAIADRRDAPDPFRGLAVQCALGLCRMAAIYAAADVRVAEPATIRAIEIAREIGEAETAAGLLSLLGNALSSAGRARFGEALRVAEEGVAAAEQANAGARPLLVARGIAWIYLIDGQFEPAARATALAIEGVEAAGHREKLADPFFAAAFMRNHLLFHVEPLDVALEAMEETYRLAVEAGNRTVQAGTTGLIAWMLLELGRIPEAEARAAQSLELAQAIGNIGGTRTAAAVLTIARSTLGKAPPSAAAELIESDRANPADFAMKSALVTEAFVKLGDLRKAEMLADLAHRYAGGRLREIWASLALGDVKRRLGPGNYKEAEELIGRAIAVATEIGSGWGLAAASLGAAELAADRGHRDASAVHGERALEIARKLRLGRIIGRVELLREELAPADASLATGTTVP